MRTNSLKITALAAGFSLIGLSVTLAADGHYYPGTMCQIALVSDAGQRALRYTRGGQVLNNSAENRAVVTCPIPRDDMDTTARLGVRVFYFDNNEDQTVRCELREMEPWGGLQIQINTNQSELNSTCNESSDPVPGVIGCSFMVGFNSVKSWAGETPGSSFTLACGLPPRPDASQPGNRSAIGGYYVVEAN